MANDEEEIKFFDSNKSRSEKLKILVYGLLPRQQKVILDHFKDVAEFTFVEQKVKYLSGTHDYVIINVKFASHAGFNFIKSKTVGKSIRLLIHKGGLVKLIEKIDVLIEQSNLGVE